MAVVWDYETQEWTFQPGVAAAVLYAIFFLARLWFFMIFRTSG